jgi:hypothetical protein
VPRRSTGNLIVLFGYSAISFAYFGWRLLPHPGRVVLGFGHDREIYIWSFAWWPHAIGSWTNPFFTHVIYAPSGVNLAWTASTPGLALAFSPITLLFGPVAAFNVAAVLLPAFSAWTAYLLCRQLTGSIWASTVGGYLFGFSTAILRQQLYGHLNLTGVFLLPIIALVLVRYLEAELSARGLAWRLGVLLALQLWISTELALTLTVFLALGLVLAFWLLRDMRPRLRSSLVPIAAGYALGAAFAAPLVVYALLGFVSGSFIDVGVGGTDLLNFVVPTRVIGVGGSSFDSVTANFGPAGSSAYLGLPTLLIVAAYALRGRRAAGARFLVAALVTSALLALGTRLQVDGQKLIALPWSAATHLPGLNNAPPFRFSVYVSLAAAVIAALWTATTKGRIYARPYVLPALAVAALVPAVWRSSYPSFHPSHPGRWAFFTDSLYKTCIPRGETVAIFPFGNGGDSMLWQAETGFWFRLAADGLQPVPRYAKPLASFDADPIVRELDLVDYGRPTMDRLLAFAATHHVDRVLSAPIHDSYPNRLQMQRFGPTQLVGGMLVAPGCGQPSLASRDLTSFVQRFRQEELGSRPNIGYCLGHYYYRLPKEIYPAGVLKGARPANFVAGQGLTCAPPPAGYKHHGFATPDMGVPADTYPLYSP